MKTKLRGVRLKMYDEFTGKFTGVTVHVKVKARSPTNARIIAKLEYDYVLRGASSFTFDDPTKLED